MSGLYIPDIQIPKINKKLPDMHFWNLSGRLLAQLDWVDGDNWYDVILDPDMIPVIHGKWIPIETETWIGANFDVEDPQPIKVTVYYCSACLHKSGSSAVNWRFCPDCGARMETDDG